MYQILKSTIMKLKSIYLIALCLCSTILVAQDNKTFSNDKYAIEYPSDWEVTTQKTQPAIQFSILANIESQKADSFRESVNLSVENLGGRNLSLKEYIDLSLKQIKIQIPSAKIVSSDPVKVRDEATQEMIWKAEFSGTKLKFKQQIFIKEGTAYILTYTATEADFDKYLKAGEAIMKSLEIK